MSVATLSTTRLFLTWSDNACQLVAKQLLTLKHSIQENPYVVVTPTREAARLLREQLAIQAAESESCRAFLSPRIMPLSQLMQGQQSCVEAGAELLLWHQILSEKGSTKSHLYPHGKEFHSENWLREAKQKIDLLRQLSTEGLDANAPAWQELALTDIRWQELGELQHVFRSKIHSMGLIDKTEPQGCNLEVGTRIIFACVPQIPQRVREMLTHGGYPINIWIHANEEQSDMFDPWGCPTVAWLQPCSSDELGLTHPDWREHYCQASDLWTMSQLAGQRAAAINAANPAPHQVSFGVCDAEMEPSIEEELSHHGASVYRPRGLSFTSSSWNKFLGELLGIIDALELSGLAPNSELEHYPAPVLIRLLKWPAMHRILKLESSPSNILTIAQILDEVQFESIPVYASTLLRQLKRKKSPVADILLQLGSELQHAFSKSTQLIKCLERWVLQSGNTDPQQAKLDAFFLTQIQQLAPSVKQESCRDILLLLQLICQSQTSPSQRASQSLDLVGWMELSYSPAQHLVITGMHNGIIPETNKTDALLTKSTIAALGLPSDELKAARDAYLLRSILAGRGMANTYFYFTLYDGKQNPLSPSSLLMRLCPEEYLSRFATHFFDNLDKLPRSPVLKADDSGWKFKSFDLTSREQLQKLAELSCEQLGIENPMAGKHFSPSSLKQFLQCPLRFWLSKVHKLNSNSVEEDKQNLNAQELGTFLHSVLEQFIRAYPCYDEKTATQWEEHLLEIFEQKYQRDYGSKALLPQELQREGMSKRLLAYLPLHRQLWEEGWECAIDNEGKPMLEYPVQWMVGKHKVKMVIDRVDQRRREDGSYEYRVLDYKTGKIDSCSKEHLASAKAYKLMSHYFDDKMQALHLPLSYKNPEPCRWTNLQLPLYAAWLREYFPKSEIGVGYVHLSRKSEEVKLMLWQSPEEKVGLLDPLESEDNLSTIETAMDSAMAWAHDCMELISEGRCFTPAEQLHWPIKKDYLFEELSQLKSIEQLFITPPTV